MYQYNKNNENRHLSGPQHRKQEGGWSSPQTLFSQGLENCATFPTWSPARAALQQPARHHLLLQGHPNLPDGMEAASASSCFCWICSTTQVWKSTAVCQGPQSTSSLTQIFCTADGQFTGKNCREERAAGSLSKDLGTSPFPWKLFLCCALNYSSHLTYVAAAVSGHVTVLIWNLTQTQTSFLPRSWIHLISMAMSGESGLLADSGHRWQTYCVHLAQVVRHCSTVCESSASACALLMRYSWHLFPQAANCPFLLWHRAWCSKVAQCGFRAAF